ncbi:protein disulfide-isomerase TMX3-like isoform X3 [Pogoniulus pusillus]|uniref:protein disulfide-isomerase TMX3-like isoform X3 n=1 Tax=Pogoniulus pusillus TaxID=488313 RepID=UPI0030B963A6
MSYLWGCEMHELTIRTTVALNASNQQCLLPDRHLEKTEDMVKFMEDILDGAAEAQAGDGLLQRSKRVLYEAKAAVMINKEQVRLKELCRKQESATCHPSPPDPNPRNPKQHLAQEVSRVAVSPSSPGILCFSQQHGVGYQQQSRLNL